MPRPTGPNFDVDQGTQVAVAVTADSAPPVGATATLKLGYRDSERDVYSTVVTQDMAVSGSTITGTLDTSALTGVQYLLQVDLAAANGTLLQRWRGVVLVTGALP